MPRSPAAIFDGLERQQQVPRLGVRARHLTERDQALLLALPAYDDGGAVDLGPLAEHLLDLAQLNPEAPQLDLMIQPPKVFDRAVLAEASQIAGPVGSG